MQSFDRNSDAVPAALSARLKLQGRWWQVYVEREFKELLQRLADGGGETPRSSATSRRELSSRVRPLFAKIAEEMQLTHPGKDLEALVEEVFRRVPGVRGVERLQGRADHGADLLVDFEQVPIRGLVQTQTVAVQIKSYSGAHEDTGAVDDLRRAFDYYAQVGRRIDMGLVVSTARALGDGMVYAMDRLSETSRKPVAALHGADLTEFFLRHGADLLRSEG